MKMIYIWILIISNLLYANEVYTVDDLILKALENSPDLKIASSQVKASKSRTDIASSSYLPKIDLHLSGGELGQSDINSNPDNMINDSLLLGKLSLKQIIYDFGRTSSSVDASIYEANSFAMQYQQIISDKKRDVKTAYYAVLKSIALIKVQKENLKLNEVQLYSAKKYFKAGIRTIIDISDAKVEVIKAQINLKSAQYNLKTAYANLDKIIGFKEINSAYRVHQTELILDNLFSSIHDYSLNLKDSINYAYENRYELKKQMQNLKATQSKSRISSSGYYPSLYLSANYTKQSLEKFRDVIPKDKWQTLLNLDWNLYQGGSTKASIQEREVQINIAQAQFQNSKLSIKKETTDAYINVYKTKDSVQLFQSLLEVSAEKFDQAGKRYKNGLSDYIELQQSRQDYIDSMASLIIGYYSYYQAVAYLDNAIGK